ncbi:UNKNOWN [Stylonychia lemnae]|uniref:Uncharacterized protein n=1 Tax=Stylonychia lemnae TaxID=5949 RepID=A0A078AC32_STYLE|nr:UNKNOWN [Stylonychia lemnae]|eukprot:CDW79391.1 UNKNOWN [Stylonychia lemnae]
MANNPAFNDQIANISTVQSQSIASPSLPRLNQSTSLSPFITTAYLRVNQIISNKQLDKPIETSRNKSNRYREPQIIIDQKFPALPYIQNNNDNQLNVPLPLTYQSVSEESTNRNSALMLMPQQSSSQNNELVLYSTQSRFPQTNDAIMQLSLAQFNHLNDLRNVTQINFAPPKPKVTFQEMVKDIRKKKAEKQKLREEKQKARENQMKEMGIRNINLIKSQNYHLPLLTQRNQNLSPLLLQMQQEDQKKNERYKKLVKNKGELSDSEQDRSREEDTTILKMMNMIKISYEKEVRIMVKWYNTNKRPYSSIQEQDEEELQDDITIEENKNGNKVDASGKLILINDYGQGQNNIESSPRLQSNAKQYLPYTQDEFNANIGKGNYKKFGGLGPNFDDEYQKQKQKFDARNDFDDCVRAMNKIKLNQITKNENQGEAIHSQRNKNNKGFLSGGGSSAGSSNKPSTPIKNKKQPKTFEVLNQQQMKEALMNSAREKAKQYAKQVRRPNRSIELAERVQERKREVEIETNHIDRFMFDPHDIRKTEESYKRLFNFQHVSIPYIDNKIKL